MDMEKICSKLETEKYERKKSKKGGRPEELLEGIKTFRNGV